MGAGKKHSCSEVGGRERRDPKTQGCLQGGKFLHKEEKQGSACSRPRSSSQVFFIPAMTNALLYPGCCIHCNSVFQQNISNWHMSLLGHEMERSQATLQKEQVTCTVAVEALQLYQQSLLSWVVNVANWPTLCSWPGPCCLDAERHWVCYCLPGRSPPAWQEAPAQLTLLPKSPLACLEKSSATMSACPS